MLLNRILWSIFYLFIYLFHTDAEFPRCSIAVAIFVRHDNIRYNFPHQRLHRFRWTVPESTGRSRRIAVTPERASCPALAPNPLDFLEWPLCNSTKLVTAKGTTKSDCTIQIARIFGDEERARKMERSHSLAWFNYNLWPECCWTFSLVLNGHKVLLNFLEQQLCQ